MHYWLTSHSNLQAGPGFLCHSRGPEAVERLITRGCMAKCKGVVDKDLNICALETSWTFSDEQINKAKFPWEERVHPPPHSHTSCVSSDYTPDGSCASLRHWSRRILPLCMGAPCTCKARIRKIHSHMVWRRGGGRKRAHAGVWASLEQKRKAGRELG